MVSLWQYYTVVVIQHEQENPGFTEVPSWGLNPGTSCLCRLSVVKLEGGPVASVKPEQKSCARSSGIITLSAQRPSDSSGQSPIQTRPQKWSITSGHQCRLTGESWFHRSTPLGIEPGSLMTGSNRVPVVHWTSETCCECSEISGSTFLKPSWLGCLKARVWG